MKKYTILSILVILLSYSCGDLGSYNLSDGENWEICNKTSYYDVVYTVRPDGENWKICDKTSYYDVIYTARPK